MIEVCVLRDAYVSKKIDKNDDNVITVSDVENLGDFLLDSY